MSKDKFSDYDSTAANNTDVGGIAIQGTNRVLNFDDALREVMSHIADNFASDTIASATTTDLGSKAAHYLTISGTTTITGLGTVKAGTLKFVTFSGALTLTHNGTSLILPGATNITTVAGDTAVFVSEGSGNWRCLDYKLSTPLQTNGWELIGAYTPSSGTGYVTQTGLSAFRHIKIIGKLAPTTDDRYLILQTSTDNGLNYDSGASDYITLYVGALATNNFASSTSASTAFFVSYVGVGNSTNEYIAFEIDLYDFNQSTACEIVTSCSSLTAAPARVRSTNSGSRTSTTARNALRVGFAALSTMQGGGYVNILGKRG